jgi:hypothetical protein
MDDVDIANDQAQRELSLRILAASRGPVPLRGTCLNCGEDLSGQPGRPIYCDSGCREDHELRDRLMRQQGATH